MGGRGRLTYMSVMDSIKGAIILRARLAEASVPTPPLPKAPAGALPLFHWVSPGKEEAAPEGGLDALERT